MAYVLVTGGTGFIGSHTAVALAEAGFKPVLLDNLSNSEKSVVESIEKVAGIQVPFFEGDCRDGVIYEKIYAEYPFDAVIHFAAYKAVGESVQLPFKYYDNNINSTVILLDAMMKLGIDKLVFSSSCTVYGKPEKPFVTEQSPLNKPESPYGYTKLVCEQMIEQVIDLKQNMRAVLLRYFNPIGAHESLLLGENPIGVPNNLVPFITQTAIGKRDKLSVFGNDYNTPDGTCVRDYIHVCDVAEAHVSALAYLNQKNDSGVHKFNIGTGRGYSVLEIVKTFEEISGDALNWEFAPRRFGDIDAIYASTELANTELNWQSKRTMKDAIEHAWNWELKHKS